MLACILCLMVRIWNIYTISSFYLAKPQLSQISSSVTSDGQHPAQLHSCLLGMCTRPHSEAAHQLSLANETWFACALGPGLVLLQTPDLASGLTGHFHLQLLPPPTRTMLCCFFCLRFSTRCPPFTPLC